MIAPHRPLTTPYGTDTFAAHLAAREAALGITQTTQDITQANSAIGLFDGDADTPDARDIPDARGSGTGRIHPNEG